MRKTWAIIRRELIAYFSSPLAYIVMTAFLILQGLIFYLIVSFLNNPQTPSMTPLRLFFGGTIYFWLFLLFLVPAITMRLIAEERRSGTIEVLLPSPLHGNETSGFVPNVVFLNGMVLDDDGDLLLYYAACDETTCLARCTINELIPL